MARMWEVAPQKYAAKMTHSRFSGTNIYSVEMNGWVHVSYWPTLDDANVEAARLNYEKNCYELPKKIGLDGVEGVGG